MAMERHLPDRATPTKLLDEAGWKLRRAMYRAWGLWGLFTVGAMMLAFAAGRNWR